MTDASRMVENRFNVSLRAWLTLFALGTIFWIGGLTTRSIIAYEFFIPGTLTFEPDISLDQERTLFQLLYASSLLVLGAYIVVLVSAVVVAKKIPLKFKDNGWLLMAVILFFMFVPVEIFTGYLDMKFILLWYNTKDILDAQGFGEYVKHSTTLRATLSHRIGALSGLPVIAVLSYLTAIVLIVWRPLSKAPSFTYSDTIVERVYGED